jgi:hypothetical protein
MAIKGTLTKFETNNYGYSVIWVQGTRYGSDKKGTINAQAGDTVEFEAFNKPDKNDANKSWPTFQYQTFRKLASVPASAPDAAVAASPAAKVVHGSTAFGNRDSYWADKEARDIEKDKRYQTEIEPRIVFQSAFKLAVDFVDLAIRNGAFAALEKAKPTAKLEILQAFVSEQASRIIAEAYAAGVPMHAPKANVIPDDLESDLPASESDDSQWS